MKLSDFRLGLGTWMLGDNPKLYKTEKEVIKQAIKSGLKVIDTAEMYGAGRSESLIGDAIKSFKRKDIYLVSKVYPHNAGFKSMERSCLNSLKRLGTDYLDLYLLHWRGGIPLEETVAAFERLKSKGYIRGWGVSNFDADDMEELWSIKDGSKCIANQVLYHIGARGIEYDLIPWLQKHNVTLMAYSPLASNLSYRQEIIQNENIKSVAQKHNATVYQIMLAFAFRHPNTIAIPRTSSSEHLSENILSLNIQLDKQDMKLIDSAFPPPTQKTPLGII
jgi:diketogulonate reductase-like aldo/keto reductase